MDVDPKQLGKLIAASITGIARPASARLPDWIDEGLPAYLDQGRHSRDLLWLPGDLANPDAFAVLPGFKGVNLKAAVRQFVD